MTDIRVTGLSELQAFLDQLPAKIEANIMRGALRAGTKVIKNRAMLNIDSKTGDLAKSLRIYTRIKDGIVKSVLASRGDYKALWVEFGTRPHLIKVQEEEKNINYRLSAKRGHTVRESMTTVNRRVLQIGNNFVGPVVSHPGAKPKPFLRPALDSEANNAIIAAGEYIKKRLATKHGLNTAEIEIGVEE